jgi:alpha-tubulin suppressor-like RCC1 family protein
VLNSEGLTGLGSAVFIGNGATTHSCVADAGGALWCWGENDYGQLGNNSTTSFALPVRVVGAGGTGLLQDVIAVDAGFQKTCALKNDETVWCWGRNYNGELGDGTTTDRMTPVQVRGYGATWMQAVSLLEVGQHVSCVITTAGKAFCWGYGYGGGLGNGTFTQRQSTPVPVLGQGE